MTKVCLSLGTNIEREKYLRAAIDKLSQHFQQMRMSPVYESEAVGFDGDAFYNMIVEIDTELPLKSLSILLKGIEDELGRDRSAPKFGSRTMDIDIVSYGDLNGVFEGIELPRPELYHNAFVLLPMADLNPERHDPKFGSSYKHLWQQLNSTQNLWKVDFYWS